MSLWAETRERLRSMLLRRREERELEEELLFHQTEAIEENIRRGMSPSEARRQAALRFGGMESTREAVRDSRGTRLLEDVLRDARFGLRRLVSDPGFTGPSVITCLLYTSPSPRDS